MFTDFSLLLNFRMNFLTITRNDLILGLKILSHCSQLILIIRLKWLDISISKMSELGLRCLILNIIVLLLCLNLILQPFNLTLEIFALRFMFTPSFINLFMQSLNFFILGFIHLFKLFNLTFQSFNELMARILTIVYLSLCQFLNPLGFVENQCFLEKLQIRNLILKLSLSLIELVYLDLWIDLIFGELIR